MGLRKLQDSRTQESSIPAGPAGSDKGGVVGGTVPIAADLGEVHVGTSKKTNDRFLPKADVKLSMLKYNEEGSLYGVLFPAGDMRVIHCFHEQRPSVFRFDRCH